jgi:hypothetical protein
VQSAVSEAEGGTGDDVLDCLGYEYLAAGRLGHHACCEVDGDAAQGAVSLDNLAHVHPCARTQAELVRYAWIAGLPGRR